MDNENIKVYEPDLGLNGTIPQLVDWANRYTSDYTDAALEKISELARVYGFDEKYVNIPLLVKDERAYEESYPMRTAYSRLKIDNYLYGNISLSMSNYGEDGTELEIRSEDDKVLISLEGADEEGVWMAAGAYDIASEFMTGTPEWLDVAIGQILFYSKQYYE